MKSVKLAEISRIGIYDTQNPEISLPDDVLIKILSVGVCGSDIHYYKEGNIGSQVVEFPYQLGHEAAGVVEETGKGVTTLEKGDLVAIEPSIFCGECSECLNDRRHTCKKLKFLGCPGQIEGCMSEYFVMPEKCCIKVPKSLSPQLAALAEPLSIGLYGIKLSGLTNPDLKIAVLGAGPIGLTVLGSCLKRGQTNVVVTDILDYRVDFAMKMGAKEAINPLNNGAEEVLKEIAPLGYDVIYECCGKQEAIDQALRLLRPGGKLVIIGIPEIKRLTFEMDLMRRKEICVQNVRRQNNSFEEAIEMICNDKSYFETMITHNFNFNESDKAFKLVAEYGDQVIKAMVTFEK